MPTKSKSTGTAASDKQVKSLLKPITGKKAAAPADSETEKKTAKKPAGETTEKPASKRGAKAAAETAAQAPEKSKEVLSLIDQEGKPKPARVRKDTTASGQVLPSISRIKAPEPVAEPEPVPQPAAPALPEGAAAEVSPTGERLVHLKPPFTVKDLSAAIGLKPFVVIKNLMDIGVFANQNQSIETDVASKICEIHGWKFEKERREKGAGVHKQEQKIEPPPAPKEAEISKDEPDVLKTRPPVVTFMGHVDHGKTTLMDTIRKARVAAGEAGGITQHIGAYSVTHTAKEGAAHSITFLDTPGHAAFTAMRARGATVTDIVVLVVDAVDGIMPQTMEALSHARAANVKIIVAITKIDLPNANVDRVKGQLQEKGLVPEDWGGDTIVCPVSAVKKQGIDHLLEMIILEAEVLELKASSKVPARATVIEAQIEQGRGPTATVIVRMGTLKVGQAFICGDYSGKVKALVSDTGAQVKEAGPSMPVSVVGFAGMPNAGDELIVMDSERDAQRLSTERLDAKRLGKLTAPRRATLENIFVTIADGKKPELSVVLKCDVQGSLEAIINAVKQIDSRKVDLKIIHSAVGPVSESDVLLASAGDAVIVGFNVKTENTAAGAARSSGIQIKLFSIIYELIDQVKEAMAGQLEPESREQVIGHAQVKQVFELTKGVVAGCYVTDGRIQRTGRARLVRNRQPIYDGGIATLRRFQDDVKEVRSGVECGIKLGDHSEYEVGDIIECYLLEKVPQTL
ncbi:MAG: translation initiation factor IF-2 [Chthoniobacteraceae bacterium]